MSTTDSEPRLPQHAALRRALAVFVALHGLAHLAGTSGLSAKATEGASAALLAGQWTASDPGLLRGLGALWALLALGYLVTAGVVWAGRPAWPAVLAAVTLASLALAVVFLWAAIVGLAIDAALLAVAARPALVDPRRVLKATII